MCERCMFSPYYDLIFRKEQSMRPEVEHGKTAILEHVKELMKTSSLDPEGLVFRWEENFDRAQWNLNIFRGRKSRQLHFREEDVEAWATTPEVAGRQLRRILHVIEMLKAG